ncbi:metalloregulator ArsR/SmtB family transcription factor [Bacillus gobiensis]|uniref:DUF2087 domain-containing protein n=1 Tax=Bacillus gobiensis TaxID=1441095 RepID=UPI003D1E9875
MQLNRVIQFHKTLGDETRLKIIALLRSGPLHGQALSGKLGLKPPTITHHIGKLKEVGLIKERREKNTVYFYFIESELERSLHVTKEIGKKQKLKVTLEERHTIEKNFFSPDGKLMQIPAQQKKKIIILAKLAEGLEANKVYSEREISDYLKRYHNDYATLRRELIIHEFAYRKNNEYVVQPSELWII